MMKAIEDIAAASPEPVTRSVLKAKLREQSFPEESLGNYFYTAINRLKSKNRIAVLEDGRIAASAKALL